MTIIDTLHPNDVLLGRGQHVKNDGNQIFRALVRTQAAAYYRATGHHKDKSSEKDTIARQIIQSFVANGGGRFVKRKVKSIDSEIDLSVLDDSSSPVLYELADEATVLVKVKQTMRDYSVCLRREKAAEQKSRRQGASASAGTAKAAVSARHSSGVAAAAAANGNSNGSDAAAALLQRQLPQQQQDEQLTQMMRMAMSAHSELDDHRLFLAALGRQNLALTVNAPSTNIPSVATDSSSSNPTFSSLDVTNQALQLLIATNQNHATLRPQDQAFQQLPQLPQQPNSPSGTTNLQSQAEQLLLLLQLQMQQQLQQQQQRQQPQQHYRNGNQPAAPWWLDTMTLQPQPLPLAAAPLPSTGNGASDSNTSTTTATASSAAIVSPLFQSVPSGTSTSTPYHSTHALGTTGSGI